MLLAAFQLLAALYVQSFCGSGNMAVQTTFSEQDRFWALATTNSLFSEPPMQFHEENDSAAVCENTFVFSRAHVSMIRQINVAYMQSVTRSLIVLNPKRHQIGRRITNLQPINI